MMDLNAPLGAHRPTGRWRVLAVGVLSFVFAICVGSVAYVLATADPQGGEPFAVATLPSDVPSTRSFRQSTLDPASTGSLSTRPPVQEGGPVAQVMENRVARIDDGQMQNGVRIYRGTNPGGPADQPTHAPLVIDVTRALDDPLRRNHGTGPKVGPSATAIVAKPRIAIFIGGLGLNRSATQTALDSMPAGVTLAFLPYGADISKLASVAKAKGHELMLQLPMQSSLGSAAPGPHTLWPDEPTKELTGDLDWLMGRFDGYVGVVNLLGGPVTANASTMNAVLRATAARHLFFVDDGTSRHSLIQSLAPEFNIAAVRADVVLDATADPATVRANLESLLVIARRNGQAIGMASGLPEHLGAIASFAAGLSAQHVDLVPVSALAHAGANMATTAR